jgi:CDP-diacylglycerol--serine O-phosphatidyltransferase
VCGALRLARFNVSPGSSQSFEGLPIPVAGILVAASAPLLMPEITLLFMLLFSLLMVSSIPYAKLRDFRVAFVLVAIVMTELFMIFTENYVVYAAILLTTSALYLISPVVIRYRQRERSQPSRRE